MTVREHQVLTVASATYRYPGARAAHIVERCGYTEPRFWQIVGALIDRPDVLAARPADVRRLQRLRESRRRQRSGRRAIA